jgi:ppGpp synthetase/RelA/SpoT-type nucleotidyltranferase
MTSNVKKLNIPIKDQVEFIEEFKNKRPDYEDFAVLLQKILQKAIGELGLMGFAEARAKNLVSFSNKIILKDKYRNPLADMTDLCGARIVVHFKSQVDKVCSFIKKNFEIDEANSLDLKSKLMVNEFGYRSIHYIVSPKKNSILGVEIEQRFKTLKAEIQVRTLAEHIWADISHDRIYKTDLNIPDEWKREAAQLSAMLENADKKFAGMAYEIDSLATVYELQCEKDKAEVDTLKLQTVISVLQDKNEDCVRNCLRLSAVYRSMDNFDKALDLLKPMLTRPLKNQFLKLKLRLEYGLLLVKSGGTDFECEDYANGTGMIDEGLKEFDQMDDQSRKGNEECFSYLCYRAGKLFQRNSGEKNRVKDLFIRAYNIMPENPLYLVALMESHVLDNLNSAEYNISLFRTNLSCAIPKLKQLIGIGINRLPAFFALGHSFMFLNDEAECINAYARAAETILCGKYMISTSTVDAELAFLTKLKNIKPLLAEEAKLYLNLAMHLHSGIDNESKYKKSICKFRINNGKLFKPQIVIIAGGASDMDQSKGDQYKRYIEEIMHGLTGTIISGGTDVGIPGLVGNVKANLTDPVNFELNAYLPKELPSNAVKSSHYDNFYETPLKGFTAFDILVCWADLICNGVNPRDVILVGIDGGRIATMEYKIALSLGAKTALVPYSGRAVSEFVKDEDWKDHRNLLILPNDPFTLWALVNQSADTTLKKEGKAVILAPIVHDYYRKMQLKKFKSDTEDINKYKVLMPWENLNPMLQASNIKQVEFYELILNRVGLKIRKINSPVLFDIEANLSGTYKYFIEEKSNESESEEKKKMSDFQVLASLEHARWNAERLLDGWKYGSEKNITLKLNPCIKAWKDLDDETKDYDYNPVRKIPTLMAEIGYEVY